MTVGYEIEYQRFGGRVALMHCLREIGNRAGVAVARFEGADCKTVGSMRARAKELWRKRGDANLLDDDAIEEALASIAKSLDCELGLPVLKLSYLDNHSPDELSFAGVGATSIPRNELTSLSRCFSALILGLNRPYAQYYRKQHPVFASDTTGLMLMEHLPVKDIWGTAWTYGPYATLEIQSKLRGVYHGRIATIGDLQRFAQGHCERVPLFDSVERICAIADSLQPSDIEFCIDERGLMLSQWRPVPRCSIGGLIGQFRFDAGDCPPPYASSRAVTGILQCVPKPAENNVASWLDRIVQATRSNEILLIRYGSDLSFDSHPDQVGQPTCMDDLASLFDVLYLTSEADVYKLPPLLIAIDNTVAWGHLHAVLTEDRRVPFAGYVPSRRAGELLALKGRCVSMNPNRRGWMEVLSEHA